MEKVRIQTRRLAASGMMLAMITALSALEHMLPPLPGLPPGVRLGLANIVTMYALFFMGRSTAITLAVLKSLFVLLMRGATAGLLSLCGGLLAILVIICLAISCQDKISYLIISIAGAISHNVGQLAMASVLLGSWRVFWYAPVLIASGVLMGSVTCALLRVAMPMLDRIVRR